jgi:ADP-ribose pyrophosphatase
MPRIRLGKLKTVYQGTIFTLRERKVIFPNGEEKIWEYCERVPSVSIMAFDKQGRLLLLKEQRRKYAQSEWFLPSGKIDKGEKPLVAARRELQEEAGYRAGTIKLAYKKYSSSTTLFWDIYVFAAKDLVWKPLRGDEIFPIQVVPTPMKKAVEMAKEGVIKNEFIAYTIIRFYELLKKKEFTW